jgi:hypothetical protein
MAVLSFALWMAIVGRAVAAGTEADCTPACDVNEVCTSSGRCITPCIPACTNGKTCNADGQCEPSKKLGESSIEPPKSSNVGGAKICVERRHKDAKARNTWTVTIDGKTVGGLRGGTKQCFNTDPGRHDVMVSYLDPFTKDRSRATKTVQATMGRTTSVAVTARGDDIVFQ